MRGGVRNAARLLNFVQSSEGLVRFSNIILCSSCKFFFLGIKLHCCLQYLLSFKLSWDGYTESFLKLERLWKMSIIKDCFWSIKNDGSLYQVNVNKNYTMQNHVKSCTCFTSSLNWYIHMYKYICIFVYIWWQLLRVKHSVKQHDGLNSAM